MIVNILQRLGGAVGIAIVSAVFTTFGRLDTPTGVINGSGRALVAAAALSLLDAATALGTPRPAARSAGTAVAPRPAEAALVPTTGAG